MMRLTWLALWLLAPGAPDRAATSLDDLLAPRTSGRVAVHLATEPARVRPGEPFTIAARVVPRAGIRVYGRDNRDYFPVTLALDWPRDVRIETPVYPAAEPYLFGPLKELVNVYERPFRITQRVTIPPGALAAAAGRLVVGGVVRYQSCDDRVCFPVEAVPVRVTIAVGPAGARGSAGSR